MTAMETVPDVQASMRLAQTRGEWDAMLACATRLCVLAPRAAVGYASVARALLELGRLDEAEDAAEQAMQRFESNPDPYVTYARVSMARTQWEEAVRRWDAMEARFPAHPLAARARAQCVEKQRFLAGDTEPAEPATPPDEATAAQADFLMKFESLGPNCEFGFLQKGFGAEPLGLLRWAGTSPEALIEALTYRFDGVGKPEQTRLTVKNSLYFAVDLRFGLRVHTGIREGEVPPETVLEKQCKRMRFLKDRLLDDLGAQRKVFTYAPYRIGDGELAEILRGLAAYGPNTLLCVRLADADHKAGSWVAAGRLVTGYSAREGWLWEGGRQRWIIDREQWLSFLHAAWRVHGGEAPFPSPGG
jgi:tetratricopeptide (TPR) repeat protein